MWSMHVVRKQRTKYSQLSISIHHIQGKALLTICVLHNSLKVRNLRQSSSGSRKFQKTQKLFWLKEIYFLLRTWLQIPTVQLCVLRRIKEWKILVSPIGRWASWLRVQRFPCYIEPGFKLNVIKERFPRGFPGVSDNKEFAWNVGDLG